MRIFQLTYPEMLKLKEFMATTQRTVRYITAESQPYGTPDEIFWNLLVAIDDVKILDQLGLGRELNDKGRTVGLWQNLGGDGIYKPRSAGVHGFREALLAIIAIQPDGTIAFQGNTWEEIFSSMPITDEARTAFLGDGSDLVVKSSAEKSSRRSGKKRRGK